MRTTPEPIDVRLRKAAARVGATITPTFDGSTVIVSPADRDHIADGVRAYDYGTAWGTRARRLLTTAPLSVKETNRLIAGLDEISAQRRYIESFNPLARRPCVMPEREAIMLRLIREGKTPKPDKGRFIANELEDAAAKLGVILTAEVVDSDTIRIRDSDTAALRLALDDAVEAFGDQQGYAQRARETLRCNNALTLHEARHLAIGMSRVTPT